MKVYVGLSENGEWVLQMWLDTLVFSVCGAPAHFMRFLYFSFISNLCVRLERKRMMWRRLTALTRPY